MKSFVVKANNVSRKVEAISNEETASELFYRLPLQLSLRDDLEIDGVKFGLGALK
jgi:hypothetical protein